MPIGAQRTEGSHEHLLGHALDILRVHPACDNLEHAVAVPSKQYVESVTFSSKERVR